MKISFRLILGILYALLVAAITVLANVTFRINKESDRQAFWVRHTHEALELGIEITALYELLQLESNPYLVSHDSGRIDAYEKARVDLNEKLSRLRDLAKDNQRQVSRVDTLGGAIAELIKYTDSSVERSNTIASEETQAAARITGNAALRQKVQGIVATIRQEEEQLLSERELSYAESLKYRNQTLVLLLSGIGVLVVMSFLTVRYNFNKRILAQQEQARALELFYKLFNEGPIPALICKANDKRVIDCNLAYEKLVAARHDAIIGNIPMFFRPLYQNHEGLVDYVIAKNGIVRDVELQIRGKSNPLWVSISLMPINIRGEHCLLFSVQDVTTHKRAEDDIKSALNAEKALNKMKSDFVTMASHEFRTPLTSIITSASLLETLPTEDKQRLTRHVNRIKTSVGLLTSILNQFLSVNTIEDGKVTPKREEFDLKHCVEETCDNLRPTAKLGQLITYTHTGKAQVLLDKTLLEIIVANLVSNALKFSQENSSVEVKTSMNHDLEMVVKDHGIGIPFEDQKNLFSRFFRSSNVGNAQGTGLGLYIVNRYVEKLNGSISVMSQPGAGTEFHVRFMNCGPDGNG